MIKGAVWDFHTGMTQHASSFLLSHPLQAMETFPQTVMRCFLYLQTLMDTDDGTLPREFYVNAQRQVFTVNEE